MLRNSNIATTHLHSVYIETYFITSNGQLLMDDILLYNYIIICMLFNVGLTLYNIVDIRVT